MKQALIKRPGQLKSFADKYRALVITVLALLVTFSGFSQTADDTSQVKQQINAYGYTWNRANIIKQFAVPRDTLRLAIRDTSSIALKNGILYFWHVNRTYSPAVLKWDTLANLGAGGGGTTDLDTSRTATYVIVSSNTGTDARILLVDPGSNKAGLMSPLSKSQLDSIRNGLISDSIAIIRHPGTDSVFLKFTAFGATTYTESYQYRDTTGGGTDSALVEQGSIDITPSGTDRIIKLVNDNATPGANQVYGTNGSGVKGWKADPAGGSASISRSKDTITVGSTSIRDSVQHGISRYFAARSTSTSIRHDAGSLILMPHTNNTWMLAHTAYGVSSGDVSSAVIVVSLSTDYGATWSAGDTAVFNVANGAYIPSLIVGAGDTIYMLYDHQPGALTSQIKKVKLAPPYTAGTWTSPTLVYGDGTKFFTPAADKITRLNSGNLLYAFSQNINSGTNGDYSSAFGAYAGRALISYDNAITWHYVPTIDIRSPDSLFGESGFVQRDDEGGTIRCQGRTRSGDVMEVKTNLSDTAFTTDIIPINLRVPNTASAIKYNKKMDLFVAVHNSLDVDNNRHRLWLSTSRDGYTWTRKVRLDSITGQKFFEPFFTFINNEVVIGYSTQDDATGDSISLVIQRVPFYYLQDGAPTGNSFEKLVVNKVNIFEDPNMFEGYYGRISRTAASVILANQTSSFNSAESWWRYTSNGIAHLAEYFVPTNQTAFVQNFAWGVYAGSSAMGDAYIMSEMRNNNVQKIRFYGDGQITGTAPGSGSNDNHFITSAWARANITGGGGGTVSDTTGSHWFTNGTDTVSIIPMGTGAGNSTIKTYRGSTIGTLNISASTVSVNADNPVFKFADAALGTESHITNSGYKLVFDGSAGFENFQFNKQIHGLHGGSVDTRYDINAGSFIYNYTGFGSNVDPFSFVVTGSTGAMGSWYGGSDAAGYSMRLTNAGLLSLGGDGTASARLDNFGKSRFRDTARLDSVFSYNTNINSRLKLYSLTPKRYVDSLFGTISGASSSYGDYTPTLTDGANVASSTSGVCHYTITGDICHVTGKITVTATANATLTEIGISLPVSADLVTGTDLTGLNSNATILNNSGVIGADLSNDRANCAFISAGTGTYSITIDFSFKIILP